ncbi:monofunctional biosynthetic peptidoglycan transglycosylase [Rhodohalobacter sp.]|uniref:monofunctional biosynthetic peptidoglycan transglycosylase n=1 Tax=Rhodohalobacter sp. TaxID=1974210 RepID=UPI002ACE05A6|nr:monofunctional biosynthetic peptidoglycan transglycosylase [Rhodohalobacter sp.]
MDLNSDQDHKPLYKKWRFYLYLLLGIAATLFFVFLLSLITLRWVNPSATSFTLQENWSELEAERYNLREYWVNSDEIPEQMKWAVIASEDQLFWDHHGFDMESIREAWEEMQSGERTRGASTISQQVAKNLYLSPAQSFLRKGIEAGITVLIELFWPKERILEVYLNIAEFGPGIFGIGKAADHFWGIKASELTPEMASRLAAVLPSPKRMRVEPPSPFAQERSLWILRQMTQLSGIAYYQPEEPEETPDEFDDIDPLLLETEFDMDMYLTSEKPDTASSDSSNAENINEDKELIDIDLPDSLLQISEPDTASANPDSVNLF